MDPASGVEGKVVRVPHLRRGKEEGIALSERVSFHVLLRCTSYEFS